MLEISNSYHTAMQRLHTDTAPTFSSFVLAGFECAYALRKDGTRLDLLADTKHDRRCREDYRMLKKAGITAVREGLAWSCIDKGDGRYAFRRFETMMAIAAEEGIEQVWDLNHFDIPAHLEFMSEEFVDAFARYAAAAVKVMRKYTDATLYIVPFNEISFFSFMGGQVGQWAPFLTGQMEAVQVQLVKATLAAQRAMHAVDPDIRFLHVDPLFRLIPKEPDSAGQREICDFYGMVRYGAWDMIAGLKNPELGGSPEMLDIVGINYYIECQQWLMTDDWEKEPDCRKTMPLNHPERLSFDDMLAEVYERYQRPIVITETGSFAEHRVPWWKKVLSEIDAAVARDIPVAGVCAYPIIDRADWGESGHLTHSGQWDFVEGDKTLARVPHKPSLDLVSKYARAHAPKQGGLLDLSPITLPLPRVATASKAKQAPEYR